MYQEKAPQASRVSAAQTLLDRGWGKAPQKIEGGENPIEFIQRTIIDINKDVTE